MYKIDRSKNRSLGQTRNLFLNLDLDNYLFNFQINKFSTYSPRDDVLIND